MVTHDLSLCAQDILFAAEAVAMLSIFLKTLSASENTQKNPDYFTEQRHWPEAYWKSYQTSAMKHFAKAVKG